MKLKLSDETQLKVVQINGSTRRLQGANRDSLEIVFERDAYPFAELESIFADKEKTAKMTIIDDSDPDEEKSYVYDDYVLRAGMTLQPVVIQPATPESPEVTEERISVVMAQLTYIEKQLQRLGVDV